MSFDIDPLAFDVPLTDYDIVAQALRFTAQEAKQAGMPDVADVYLSMLVRLQAGDVELQPHRLTR